MATEVSFYHLTVAPLERALPALVEKVHTSGSRAVLLAATKQKLEQLNTLLWTYGSLKFLPHGTAEDGEPSRMPIFLTTKEENPNKADILVSVEGVAPEFSGSFRRCLDVFDGNNEAEVQAARARWKAYEKQGFTLSYWKQKEDGGWEKAA